MHCYNLLKFMGGKSVQVFLHNVTNVSLSTKIDVYFKNISICTNDSFWYDIPFHFP